ncbi:MAG: ABC transporter permease [Acidobacteria bacterium]|nr:ABC transporter permease [Acidobacteriota bacterium]
MALFRRLTNLFRQPAIDRDIADELQSHIDLRIESNLASGMLPEEARRDALLRFGNPTSTRERVAAFDASLALASLGRDIRYAARQLRRSPGFTITVISTLAIGIGVNVAIFSSMDAVVLRPLAVPALDRVMVLAEQQQRGKEPVTLADFNDLRRQNRSFEDLAVLQGANYTLSGAGDAAQISADLVSSSFFSVLRTQAFLGRVFDESECQPGRDAVVVLNYGFWKRHFGASSRIIGQKVQLDQHDYTIIGVLPRTMQYPPAVDMLLPFAPTASQLADRSDHAYLVIGRVRDGVTLKSAQSEMQLISERLAKSYPATNQGWSVHVEPLLNDINGDLTPLYYKLIMGATMFVLLVVCANVANLQLARGVARRSEIAMRTALGATRKRIIRQLLTENILLALVGAGLGIALAAIYLHLTLIAMPARVARYIPGWDNISINGRALAFSVFLAVLSGIIAGLAPSIETLRIRLVDQLRAGSRQATGRSRLRSIFAVAQISLAVALVIGAALMAKGMSSMFHQADIYSPEKILTLHPDLPTKRYDTPEKQAQWYISALDRLRAIPGASRVELATALPYTDSGWELDLAIENRPTTPGKLQTAVRLAVTPGYFDAFHIPILDGRNFSQGDSVHTLPVVIVSHRFVDLYFGGANPIGHRIRLGDSKAPGPWLTIVGIAQEANYSLWENDHPPAVYTSSAQQPLTGSTITIFSNGDPIALANPARKALASIDAGVPLDPVQTYRDLIRDNLVGLMYAASMLALDAFIALLLSAIGIFAVMANLVGERTREIGVRLAMGASKEDVLRMIIRRASWLTGTGLIIGLALAFALARLVANLLRGVRPDDPITFATVTLIIIGVALAASWLPARQAARVDPMQALRSE